MKPESAFFADRHRTWSAWRHDLHQHPELAYNEHRISAFVAERLSAFGIDVQKLIESRMHEICAGVGASQSLHITLDHRGVSPLTINCTVSQLRLLRAAVKIVAADTVYSELKVSMASEDFSFMLNEVTGAYAWLGNGPVDTYGVLHSPVCDFTDAILPVGAQLLAKLTEGPDN